MIAKMPPQDLDAERALLGSMMLNRDGIGDALTIVHRNESGWFYRPDHRRLFEALVDMYDRGDPIDMVTLRNELNRRGLLKEVGGVEYITDLAESVPSHLHAEQYARIVRDKGLKRDLFQAAEKIRSDAYADGDDAEVVLDRAEQILFQVTDQRVTNEPVPLSAVVPEVVMEVPSDQQRAGLATGFASLDAMLTLEPGAMIVIAARPSMGKTAFGLAVADHLAEGGSPVACFSLEMGAREVARRLISARTGIDLQRLQRGHLNPSEREQVAEAEAHLVDVPLFVDGTPGMSVLELRAKSRRLKARFGIDAIFIDYLQLMTGAGKSENRQAEVATMSRALKALARELNIPVVVLAQLNRNPEGRADNRPRMGDLRESGAIEQDADCVVLLHRPEYYLHESCPADKRGVAEVIIDKQRNGPTGVVRLGWEGPCARFTDLQTREEEEAIAQYQATQIVPF